MTIFDNFLDLESQQAVIKLISWPTLHWKCKMLGEFGQLDYPNCILKIGGSLWQTVPTSQSTSHSWSLMFRNLKENGSINCPHNQRGYCKWADTCRKEHVAIICTDLLQCKNSLCKFRHPRLCRCFPLDQICKFGSKCSHQHKHAENVHSAEVASMRESVCHHNNHP